MNIKAMIPFLDDDELEQLADKVMESEDGEYKGVKITTLIPFLDDEYIDKIALSELKKGHRITTFIPFVSDDFLHDMITANYLRGEAIPNMASWLPFLEDEDITAIFRKLSSEGGKFNGLSINDVLPFIDDDELDKAFASLIISGNAASVSDMASFVSDEALHKVAKEYSKGRIKEETMNALWQYFDDDDIRAIFKHAMSN